MLSDLGFVDVTLVGRFDPFRGTSKETLTRKFGVRGVNVLARKP